MNTESSTAENFLHSLPDDRKKVMTDIRDVLLENLPEGFEEVVGNGMLHYVVSYSLYPQGYHCKPQQPLPFMSLASQKNFVALYHMGIYADENLLGWFRVEYQKVSTTKLDMGKSCIRFKKPDQIPLDLIGALASKMSPQKWISIYEKQVKR